ncbi:hypothetical protein [Desulfovibrio psychrotolerans]|uniref:Uncharacterized protein n=1 Tax=Desulfovibrio psychrotolerans TaxID=415242 RepID=A0A7J0BXS7_9BACT|nr:hypothetical protein [Desulfovibrio psychrotolerans]GFM37995.1 hypothetical protein DSM19430T_26790 [Desulfovibrio psychrotolerans]
MQVIKVTRSFALRHAGKQERRTFTVGMHKATQEDMEHWYMQTALKEGWADVVVEAPSEATPEDYPAEVEAVPVEGQDSTQAESAEPAEPVVNTQAKKAKK